MPVAYVFINAETDTLKEVLSDLRKITGVEEAHAVYGVHDVVVKVKADSINKLKKTIISRVRKVNNVHTTLTMIVVEP